MRQNVCECCTLKAWTPQGLQSMLWQIFKRINFGPLLELQAQLNPRASNLGVRSRSSIRLRPFWGWHHHTLPLLEIKLTCTSAKDTAARQHSALEISSSQSFPDRTRDGRLPLLAVAYLPYCNSWIDCFVEARLRSTKHAHIYRFTSCILISPNTSLWGQ